MPVTQVVFYKELNGAAPVLVWLQTLRKQKRTRSPTRRLIEPCSASRFS